MKEVETKKTKNKYSSWVFDHQDKQFSWFFSLLQIFLLCRCSPSVHHLLLLCHSFSWFPSFQWELVLLSLREKEHLLQSSQKRRRVLILFFSLNSLPDSLILASSSFVWPKSALPD
jgi:hypothetical protein